MISDKKSPNKTTNEKIKEELDELKRTAQLITEQFRKENSKLLNFNQAADYLGLSHSYLYKLTCHKLIPCHRPMHRLYFFKEELDAWVRRRREDG